MEWNLGEKRQAQWECWVVKRVRNLNNVEKQENVKITAASLKKQLKKMASWKSPGLMVYIDIGWRIYHSACKISWAAEWVPSTENGTNIDDQGKNRIND